ncbi:hypothetical protein ACHAPU_010135 [Fusarium lateritium]
MDPKPSRSKSVSFTDRGPFTDRKANEKVAHFSHYNTFLQQNNETLRQSRDQLTTDLKYAKAQIRKLDVDNKQRPTEADLRRQQSSSTALVAKISEYKSTISDLKRNVKLQEQRILVLTRQLAAIEVKASEAEADSKERLVDDTNKDQGRGTLTTGNLKRLREELRGKQRVKTGL